MKNRRIGAAAIINRLHLPKNKERKTERQKSTEGGEREGPNPLIWSPIAAVNSTTFTQEPLNPITHPKKNIKKAGGKDAKTAKRGLEPAHLTSYCCSNTITICNMVFVYRIEQKMSENCHPYNARIRSGNLIWVHFSYI